MEVPRRVVMISVRQAQVIYPQLPPRAAGLTNPYDFSGWSNNPSVFIKVLFDCGKYLDVLRSALVLEKDEKINLGDEAYALRSSTPIPERPSFPSMRPHKTKETRIIRSWAPFQ